MDSNNKEMNHTEQTDDALLKDTTSSLATLGRLTASVFQGISSPIQYMTDNMNFLKEAFEDIQHLVDYHQDLVEALRRGKVNQTHIDKVDAACEKADLDYLEEEIPKAVDQTLDGVTKVTELLQAMMEFTQTKTEEVKPIDFNRAIISTLTFAEKEWTYRAKLVTDLDPALSNVPCFSGELNVAILNSSSTPKEG